MRRVKLAKAEYRTKSVSGTGFDLYNYKTFTICSIRFKKTFSSNGIHSYNYSMSGFTAYIKSNAVRKRWQSNSGKKPP